MKMDHPKALFNNGQPMDIPCEVKYSPTDDERYLVFYNEFDADDYEDAFGINLPRYSFGGFMNAMSMSDLIDLT